MSRPRFLSQVSAKRAALAVACYLAVLAVGAIIYSTNQWGDDTPKVLIYVLGASVIVMAHLILGRTLISGNRWDAYLTVTDRAGELRRGLREIVQWIIYVNILIVFLMGLRTLGLHDYPVVVSALFLFLTSFIFGGFGGTGSLALNKGKSATE